MAEFLPTSVFGEEDRRAVLIRFWPRGLFDGAGVPLTDLRPILASLQDAQIINNSNDELLADILLLRDPLPGGSVAVSTERLNRLSAGTKHVKAIIDTLVVVVGHLCEALGIEPSPSHLEEDVNAVTDSEEEG